MKILSAVLIASISLFSNSVASQDIVLSDSELAAISQRGISEQERQLKREGCAYWGQLSTSITLGNDLRGWLADIPKLQFLIQQTITRNLQDSDTFDISATEALPNGGIGGKDLCATAQIINSNSSIAPGGVASYLGLILRHNINLEEEYPNTSKVIMDREQLFTIDNGRFALFSVENMDQVATLISEFSKDSNVDLTKGFVHLGGVLLVPLQ